MPQGVVRNDGRLTKAHALKSFLQPLPLAGVCLCVPVNATCMTPRRRVSHAVPGGRRGHGHHQLGKRRHRDPHRSKGLSLCHPWGLKQLLPLLLLSVVAASIWAGIALDRAGWRYRKQLWQFQGATIGLVAGYLLGRSRLI